MIGYKAGSFLDEIAARIKAKNAALSAITGDDVSITSIVPDSFVDPYTITVIVAVKGYRGTVPIKYNALPLDWLNSYGFSCPISMEADENNQTTHGAIWQEWIRLSGYTPFSLPLKSDTKVTLTNQITEVMLTCKNLIDFPTGRPKNVNVRVRLKENTELSQLISGTMTAPVFDVSNTDEYIKFDANKRMPDKDHALYYMSKASYDSGLTLSSALTWGMKYTQAFKDTLPALDNNRPEFHWTPIQLSEIAAQVELQGSQPIKVLPIPPAGGTEQLTALGNDLYLQCGSNGGPMLSGRDNIFQSTAGTYGYIAAAMVPDASKVVISYKFQNKPYNVFPLSK